METIDTTYAYLKAKSQFSKLIMFDEGNIQMPGMCMSIARAIASPGDLVGGSAGRGHRHYLFIILIIHSQFSLGPFHVDPLNLCSLLFPLLGIYPLMTNA